MDKRNRVQSEKESKASSTDILDEFSEPVEMKIHNRNQRPKNHLWKIIAFAVLAAFTFGIFTDDEIKDFLGFEQAQNVDLLENYNSDEALTVSGEFVSEIKTSNLSGKKKKSSKKTTKKKVSKKGTSKKITSKKKTSKKNTSKKKANNQKSSLQKENLQYENLQKENLQKENLQKEDLQKETDKQEVNTPAPTNDWSDVKTSSGSYTFRSDYFLTQHFKKHGSEFPYSSMEDYVEGANKVINSKDALHKLEAEDGDDVYYLEDSNEIVFVSTDGYIRTYFKPWDGIRYYDRQ